MIRVPVRALVSRVCPGSPYNVCVFSSKLVSRNTQVPKQTQPRARDPSTPVTSRFGKSHLPSLSTCLLVSFYISLKQASKAYLLACLLTEGRSIDSIHFADLTFSKLLAPRATRLQGLSRCHPKDHRACHRFQRASLQTASLAAWRVPRRRSSRFSAAMPRSTCSAL